MNFVLIAKPEETLSVSFMMYMALFVLHSNTVSTKILQWLCNHVEAFPRSQRRFSEDVFINDKPAVTSHQG